MKKHIQNLIITLACFASLSHAAAQGTAFTYQGRLNDGANPANGSYDLRFIVYDASVGGSQQGPILTNSATAVSGGQFNLVLDFGNVFDGSLRWLEIAVRTNGGGVFSTLNPRQPLTPAPYAIVAGNVPNGAIDTPQLAVGAVTASRLGSNAVTNAKMANGAVDTPELAGGAVTTPKLADDAVTSAKVADGTLRPVDLDLASFSRTFWQVGGNTGTSTDFIGTTDDQPFDVRVNNARVMRYRLNTDPTGFAINAPNVIGGSSLNTTVTTGIVGATIAGGGGSETNYLTGGFFDQPNTVTAHFGAIGGGDANAVSGRYGTVPGGTLNVAGGYASLAAGFGANANHNYSFVWSDGSASTGSASASSVTMRASGGYRFFTGDTAVGAKLAAGDTSWSTISDRNEKKNSSPVNAEAVLEKLAAVPIQSWNYKWESDTNTPHMGPMAQDFKAAFYPGRDDKSISTLEFDGVELAAIQGLNQKVEDQRVELKQKQTEITELKQKNEALEKRLEAIEKFISQKSN